MDSYFKDNAMRHIAVLLSVGISMATAWGQAAVGDNAGTKQPAPPTTAPATSQPVVRPVTSQPVTRPDFGGDVRRMLNSRVAEVNFDQVPLEQALEWVEQYTGALVYARWAVLEEAGIARDTPVTVKTKNRKLSRILWVIMNEAVAATGASMAYEASAELFVFSTRDDLESEMVVRIYDVKDIIMDIPNFGEGVKRTRVRRRHPTTSWSGETGDPPYPVVGTNDDAMQEFVDLVTLIVAPESWAVNGLGGQGTIFPFKGKIIVRNSRHVQQLIGGQDQP
ncbi:MAG: hypothetical protein ABIG44_15505 [Planctomycetota bacterium]